MATEKQKFIWAIGEQESGNRYGAVNPGSGALGRWQVMPSNVCSWTARAYGRCVSGSEFLHTPHIQDRVAWVILGGDFDRYGAAGAAAVWYCGQPTPRATFGNPPVYVYVDSVLRLMGRAPQSGIGVGSGGSGSQALPSAPKPDEWDSSPVLKGIARQLWFAGEDMHNSGQSIVNTRKRYG